MISQELSGKPVSEEREWEVWVKGDQEGRDVRILGIFRLGGACIVSHYPDDILLHHRVPWIDTTPFFFFV